MGNIGGRRHQRKQKWRSVRQGQIEAAPQGKFVQRQRIGIEKVTAGLRASRAGRVEHGGGLFGRNARKREPFERRGGNGGNVLPARHDGGRSSFGLAQAAKRDAGVELTGEQGDGQRIKIAVALGDKSGNMCGKRMHRPQL